MEKIFEKFDVGTLLLPRSEVSFTELEWHDHPAFEGVQLKHIVTADVTDGEFSCHLVKIAPNKKIGDHVHEKQTEIHEVVGGFGVCITAERSLNTKRV